MSQTKQLSQIRYAMPAVDVVSEGQLQAEPSDADLAAAFEEMIARFEVTEQRPMYERTPTPKANVFNPAFGIDAAATSKAG
ncbi:MAG: hypothetical protein C0511_12040 [Hyphomicrobium sp.]|nr:hypothetical protein [Hyphomicrobium sp.]PPC81097.1 MAG: hypothetical protein CTY40_07805 [Hyphomicrobium sp.]